MFQRNGLGCTEPFVHHGTWNRSSSHLRKRRRLLWVLPPSAGCEWFRHEFLFFGRCCRRFRLGELQYRPWPLYPDSLYQGCPSDKSQFAHLGFPLVSAGMDEDEQSLCFGHPSFGRKRCERTCACGGYRWIQHRFPDGRRLFENLCQLLCTFR